MTTKYITGGASTGTGGAGTGLGDALMPIKDVVENVKGIMKGNAEGKETDCSVFAKETGGICLKSVISKLQKKEGSTETAPAFISRKAQELGCSKSSAEKCVVKKIGTAVVQDNDKLRELILVAYKHEGPSDLTEWLSNFDTDGVLHQLSIYAPYFQYINFQMRDFASFKNNPLKNLDLHNVFTVQGKRCFGVILNTDVSSGQGEHWYCIFAEYNEDANTVSMECYNSGGGRPLPETHVWMEITKHMLEEKGIKTTMHYSNPVQQKDKYSCGVFSTLYIILRTLDFPRVNVLSTLNDFVVHAIRKNILTYKNT